jgi:hypothetical protein
MKHKYIPRKSLLSEKRIKTEKLPPSSYPSWHTKLNFKNSLEKLHLGAKRTQGT